MISVETLIATGFFMLESSGICSTKFSANTSKQALTVKDG